MIEPLPNTLLSTDTHKQSLLTLITLSDWALISVTGPDAERYLQGQITYDIHQLNADKHVLCAHCDAKGKVWSSMRLFHWQGGFGYLQLGSLNQLQPDALRKYAVFSKLNINVESQTVLLGVTGSGARDALERLYPYLPDAKQQVVSHTESQSTLLYLAQPSERFILILSPQQADWVREQLRNISQLGESQQWQALDIAAGLPIIDEINSGQFIPQALNLQALEAISFTKGCYIGQEMVARAKYRGANKRAMYWLIGHASRIPHSGEDLELQLGENWRRTGRVLAACQMPDGTVWIQAVLNNDLTAHNLLRVRDDQQSTLRIHPLPYSLQEETTD